MSVPDTAFWDRVARRYATMAIRNPADYEATLDKVRARLKPDDKVLELGCGTGTTALRLADAVAHYVASDFSAEMIAIADEKRTAAGIANVTPCTGQLGDGSIPEGPYDAILAFNLLHLLPDRPRALAEIARNLDAGGLFMSKTPCLGGPYRLLQPLLWTLRRFGKAPDFHFLSPARLEREMTQAGFEILERGDHPNRPPRRFIVATKR